jgi:hypothetical protein
MPFTPLSFSAHAGLRLIQGTLKHLECRPLLVLSTAEASRAALDLPLVFARTDVGLQLLALLSLSTEDNAQVGPKGRWMGGYVPASLRAHPFQLGPPIIDAPGTATTAAAALTEVGTHESPAQATTRVVLVEAGSDWLSRAGGDALFEPDGSPTPVLERRLALLRTEVPPLPQDVPVLAAIAAAGVLTPWTEAPDGLPGPLYTASRERLDDLDATRLAALRDAGALGLLYAQLLSLPRVHRLRQLARRKAQMRERLPMGPGLDEDFVLRFDDDEQAFAFD